MLRSVLLLFVLLLPSVQAAEAPVILVVGDSLSAGFGLRPGEGWTSLLEARLDEEGYPHRVVNASISGDTTEGALARLPRALEIHDPALVIIELGGNDGLRGFPMEVMRDNLAAMIRLSRESGAEVLLLGMRLPPNYGPAYTGRFHQVFVDLAESREVPLVSFFLDGVALNGDLMQPDGIHPNAAAQPKLLENVWSELEPLLTPAPRAASLP